MNWKQIMYKGLPVLVIAIVILVVAIIVGRPKAVPVVTKANDVVVNFNGYKVTKGELYDLMKKQSGSAGFMDVLDKILLADYTDKVDTTLLEDKIQADITSQGETPFYESMVNKGVLLSVDQADRDQLVKNYYIVDYLQRAYAYEQASNTITAEQIATAKANYHEDLCVITLTFDTMSAANAEVTKLNALTGQAVIDEFASVWTDQKSSDTTTTEVTYPSFLDGYSCNYDRAVYTDYASTSALRDFLFKDSFAVGTYNQTPVSISPSYYVVYKYSQAPLKSTYNQADFEAYLKDQLVSSIVTTTYISDEMVALRSDKELKIYDSYIADQYKATDTDFSGVSKINGKNNVASYLDANGDRQFITADQFYEAIKAQYAVSSVLDHLDYYALKQVDGIQFTKSEKASYMDQVKSMKSSFLSSGYGKYMSWADYIFAYYGATSDTDLSYILSLSDFKDRYVLGNDDKFAGSDPVTWQEVKTAYDNWFQYQASHILFEFDPTDQASQDLALLKAQQVIRGCTETEVDTDTCYIEYTGEPFTGLNSTTAATLPTVFATLATSYSEDTGSASTGGDLGTFGYGEMTDPFTTAVQNILAANNGIKGGYSLEPVYDVIERPTGDIYGYHVIYVTGNTVKTTIPTILNSTYDSQDAIFEHLSDLADFDNGVDADNTAVSTFYTFVTGIQSNLKTKHQASANYDKQLAELLDSQSTTIFSDADIQAHYNAMKALQEDYTR